VAAGSAGCAAHAGRRNENKRKIITKFFFMALPFRYKYQTGATQFDYTRPYILYFLNFQPLDHFQRLEILIT
jgi:hypothetical protein